ncbi:hypothetical protein SDRG_03134 [Saprolegnia diclina VS20]|uniref:Protein FAM221A n=1 Tax=Saprolegnia diclina (strain VS20) TaxID=1156394 RepID=T0QYE0_SAPDV|nr:hypothetical protein SDRG_03134 [Saprolegnia diclina VS20]EQC39706.1 hypothetical protein SDRG_03134 [Saprolegnia diclina VS20]|eukprot:XP_008606978.1 hypothetical protein SDRG_03134 [Saprolegnia diclina VS20]
MPQEWYAAHDAASSTSMTRDPSKLALLKRKMAKKEAPVVAGPPPPVPPRRSSSDLVAPVDALVTATLSEAPSSPAKPPLPLPRRRSESTRHDAPASRIPTKRALPVPAPMTSSAAVALVPADVVATGPNELIVADADSEKQLSTADDSVDECTAADTPIPAPSGILSMPSTIACAKSSAAPMSAMPIPADAAPFARKSFQKLVVKWSCNTCTRECIPVREESRCLCGHRLKEHPSSVDDPRVKDAAKFTPFACTMSRCVCKSFFYIVAEGAWILRCRCKHKHIEHDAGRPPFVCKKPKCGCTGFDSPWVCNCAHPWSDHRQTQEIKTFHPLQMDLCDELSKVYRTDLEAEPLSLHT